MDIHTPNTHDLFRPTNPEIPFFPTRRAFAEHPKPNVASIREGAKFPYLVEPGIQSVEAYEAIIRHTLNQETSLNIYMCRAGVLQVMRISKASYDRRNQVYARSRNLKDRSMSFVMLTFKEHEAISSWFEKRNFMFCFALQWLTPFGVPIPHVFVGTTDPGEARHQALEELGLSDSTFSRSLLTSEEDPFPLTLQDLGYMIPGPDCDAFHGQSFEDRERVEWVPLTEDDTTTLAIRGKKETEGQ